MKTRYYLFTGFKAAAKQLWDIEEAAIDHLYYAGLAVSSVAIQNVASLQQGLRNNISRMLPQQGLQLNIALPFRKG